MGGEVHNIEFQGLIAFAGQPPKTFMFKSNLKRSSVAALKVIHRMLLDSTFAHQSEVQDEFRTYEPSVLMELNLGKHFEEAQSSKSAVNHAFEIIQFLLRTRSYLTLD